jgi:hypothetical protein
MIGTNARTVNGMAVVRATGLRERLVRRLGESAAWVRSDEPADVGNAARTLHEGNDRQPWSCDPGATPTRWVRLV